MNPSDQSQDPLFIEDKPLLSHLFLSTAVYPHLTKAETNLLEAIWHRTARFGLIGHTLITFKTISEGFGETENWSTDGDFSGWGAKRFPIYPELTERHFKRVRARLIELGLIRQKGKGSERSWYRVSCYPRDFVERGSHIQECLERDQTVASYSILRDMTAMTLTLKRFKRL